MSAGHTPGPWSLEDASQRIVTDDYVGVFAERANPGDKLPAQCYGPNREANARLIAAAPELLEPLKGLRDELENIYSNYQDVREQQDKARKIICDAIAKAEGRAP